MILWRHQQQALEIIRLSALTREGRCLVVCPPGAGKSEIGIRAALEWLQSNKRNRVTICVPATRPIVNFYHRLAALTATPIGFLQGKRTPTASARIVIATQQAILERGVTFTSEDLLIVDEAHHSSLSAPTWKSVVANSPRVIGLSATAWSGLLSSLFDRVFFYSRTQALEDRVVCDIALSTFDNIESKDLTLVFVRTNSEAANMCASTPRSAWIGHTREESINLSLLAHWRSRRILTLFASRMLLESFDLPDIERCYIALDIRSEIMAGQIIGRCMRYRPEKRSMVLCRNLDGVETCRRALALMDSLP